MKKKGIQFFFVFYFSSPFREEGRASEDKRENLSSFFIFLIRRGRENQEEQNEWFHLFSTSLLFSGKENGEGEEEKKKYHVMKFR